jgi:hypothetical protein
VHEPLPFCHFELAQYGIIALFAEIHRLHITSSSRQFEKIESILTGILFIRPIVRSKSCRVAMLIQIVRISSNSFCI